MVTSNDTNPPTVVNVPTTPAAGYSVTGGVVISSSDTEKFKYVFNEQVYGQPTEALEAGLRQYAGPNGLTLRPVH